MTTSSLVMPVEVSTTRSGWLMRMPSTVASPLPLLPAVGAALRRRRGGAEPSRRLRRRLPLRRLRFRGRFRRRRLLLRCRLRLRRLARCRRRGFLVGRRWLDRLARGRSPSRPCPRAGRGRPRGGCGRPASTRRTTPRRPASARPSGRARRAACSKNGVVSAGDRGERLLHRGERLLVEAAADAAGEAQVPGLVVDAEQQRADAGARALRVGPAADHELLALRALELDPGRAAPRHVGRVGALADHPLEAHPAGVLEQLLRARVEVLAEADALLQRRAVEQPRRARRAARPAARCAGRGRRSTAGRRRSTGCRRCAPSRRRSAAR